jgi:putative transposase
LIAAEKTTFPVAVMCRVLQVSRTGFYNWERRVLSDRALTDAWLTDKIRQIHEQRRGVYGAPRIHAELRMEHDVRVGRKRVARLMKDAGISGVTPRKRYRTTIRIPGITPATDLVERQFRPDRPNVLWVADITYLRTGEGWLYLAAVQDAYSRQIVGWAMATHMRATLVLDALKMALARRRPPPGLIHHSDQGSQYVSLAFGRAARRRGDRGLDGLPRRRVRQRGRRDVLRDAQKGARQPPHLARPARAAVRGVRVHRGVLQPPAPALHPRDALPGRLRTTTTHAALRLRSMTGTRTINRQTRCHANRGRSRALL